jgi:choline dehydrogenase-like flavoprotein
MRHSEPDIVIVGSGIAGGAQGTVLARARFEVVLLERESNFPDRVRGEFMPPWGVTETRQAHPWA